MHKRPICVKGEGFPFFIPKINTEVNIFRQGQWTVRVNETVSDYVRNKK